MVVMDKLHRNIVSIVSRHRHQKHTTRTREKIALIAIAKDAYSVGICCDHFKSLNELQIQKLIDCWKSKENSKRTIYIKLSLLEKYFHLKVKQLIKKNNLLDADHSIMMEIPTWPWICSDSIDDPLIRKIATAQQLFGLKYREVITLRRSMLLYGNVNILRKYAFNGKDRFIPIETEQQKNWVIEFHNQLDPQLDNVPSQRLIRQVRESYKLIALPDLDYFRYQYTKTRYQYLCNSITASNVERHALKQLRSELGLSHNGYVRKMLSYLKDCQPN